MIQQAYLTLISLFFTVSVLAQSQDTWTVDECILYAIEHSLSVELADVNMKTAEVNRKQARHARWPNLNMSSSFGLNFGRVINPSTNTFETDDSYFNSFGVSTGMPLYAGSQVTNSIKQSELDVEASTEDLKQARVQLAFEVSTAFLNVLFSQENLRNAEATLDLSRQQLEQIDKLIAAGTRPEAERYDIVAQISLDEQNVVRFSNDIVQNELVLKQLMRLEPDFPLELETPDIERDILGQIDTYTFESVYEAALETQPQVRAQELRIESAMLDEKIMQGSRFPSLSIGASAGTNWTDLDKFPVAYTPSVQSVPVTVSGIPGVPPTDVILEQQVDIPTEYDITAYGDQLDNNLGYGVSLNLSIPIYNNYRNKANVDRARLNIVRAKNSDEQIKQNLKTNIQNALASAQAAREALEASEHAFEAAEIAYQNSERRFDLGTLNSYDLISARNRLDQSRVNVTIAKYDYVFRILVLEYYLGRGLKYE